MKREPFYVQLGKRIQRARLKLGLTQEELGALTYPPMTRANIGNIEQGRQRLLGHTTASLAKALRVPITQLIGKERAGRVVEEMKRDGE